MSTVSESSTTMEKATIVEDKSTTQTNNNTSPNATHTQNTPSSAERKILIFREMPDNTTEESLRGVFKSDSDLANTITNVREDVDHTWFVTFTSGDSALQAYKFAMGTTVEGKSLQVRFKTVGAYTNSSAVPASQSQIPYNGNYTPGEYQAYWDQQTYDYTRNNAFRPNMAGARMSAGAAPYRTANHGKPKGGRQNNTGNNATGGNTRGNNQQGGSIHGQQHQQQQQPSGDAAKAPEAGNASNHTQGGSTHPRAASGTSSRSNDRTNNVNAAGGNNRRSNGAAHVDRRAGRSERNKETGSHATTTASGTTVKSTAQASLNLTNFPPLGPPSGTTVRANNGYQGKPFIQYSRADIVASITQRESSTVVRPNFDNSDSPILLTSAQLDLEINKPLPVGAKFEPLAQDKRSRSLSKNAAREAVSSTTPTAAQIVAAAAAKTSSQPAKKVTSAATTKAAPAADKKDKSSGNSSKAATQKPASPVPTTTTATTTTSTTTKTTSSSATKSWAELARSPAAIAEPAKVDKPAVKPAAPVATEKPAEIAEEVTPVPTPDTTVAQESPSAETTAQ